ncbi:hypothetical protein B0H13DRAFT_2276739 [Mycena leptocephala]|nr:hypothetical protein B0H13DRAFT_2276739 [Mycena leptocephala]
MTEVFVTLGFTDLSCQVSGRLGFKLAPRVYTAFTDSLAALLTSLPKSDVPLNPYAEASYFICLPMIIHDLVVIAFRGSMASVRYDRWPENGVYDRREADVSRLLLSFATEYIREEWEWDSRSPINEGGRNGTESHQGWDWTSEQRDGINVFPTGLSDPNNVPFFSVEDAPIWITSLGYQLYLVHDDSEVHPTLWRKMCRWMN